MSPNNTVVKRTWTRGNLAAAGPGITADEWDNPAQVIEKLQRWATERALDAVNWYQRDKRDKRWASRLLRAGAVVLAVAGGVAPLVSTTDAATARLGYIVLAGAAGCVAFDHFFGLSSGWMRDISAMQTLQSSLTRFHLDWLAWQANSSPALANPATSGDAVRAALELIDRLVTQVVRVTEAETMQWITDFHQSVAVLRQQADPGITSPQDLFTWSQANEVATK